MTNENTKNFSFDKCDEGMSYNPTIWFDFNEGGVCFGYDLTDEEYFVYVTNSEGEIDNARCFYDDSLNETVKHIGRNFDTEIPQDVLKKLEDCVE